MIEKIQIVVVALLIPLGIYFWYSESNDVSLMEMFLSTVDIAHVGDLAINVKIADSDSERVQGLSGVKTFDELGEGIRGLLFVFPKADYHGIWMKDMNFAIDIIWIGENNTVIDIDENVLPETFPNVYRPKEPAKYLIETPGRFIDMFGVKIGDVVRLPL